MITNLISVYQAIEGRYQAAQRITETNQQRMNLLEGVRFGGGRLPADQFQLSQKEKALEMEAVHARVMFAAYQTLQEEATQRLKSDLDLERRLMRIWTA